MHQVKNIFLWILQLGSGFILAEAGWAKLTGAPFMIKMFDMIGFGQWFRFLTGGLEVIGPLLMLIPLTTGASALMLCGVMGGAIITHFTVLHSPPTKPVELLVALLIIVWGRWDSILKLLKR